MPTGSHLHGCRREDPVETLGSTHDDEESLQQPCDGTKGWWLGAFALPDF